MRIFKLKRSLLLLAFVAMSSWLGAQTITGTVTDDFGPVSNVEVKAVNANVTAYTDIDGNYTLEGVSADDTLEFVGASGEVMQEKVNGRTQINKTLSDTSALQEIVVIGFGTIKKEDATGAVDVLSSDDFNKGVTTAPDQLLQGKMAGVQVTTNSGEPGAAAEVRIRGNNSVRAGNTPLYIIDGVPFNTNANSSTTPETALGTSAPLNPLNYINNADIESITVLKDASATAIYGSQAANGVILITTKKGLSKKPMFNFNSSFSVSTIARALDLLNAAEYRTYNPTQDRGSEVDPFKEITNNSAGTQDYQFSMRGGNADQQYRISMGALMQNGVLKHSNLKKYNAGAFLSQKLFNEKLDLSTNINFSQINNSYAPNSDNVGAEGDLLTTTYAWNPTKSFYNEDGTFLQEGNSIRNPLAMLAYYTAKTKSTRIFGNLTADLELTKGLTYRFLYGADNTISNGQTAVSRLLDVNEIYQRGYLNFQNLNYFNNYLENTLNYDGDLSSSINIKATVGTTYQKLSTKGNSTVVRDFLGGAENLDNQQDYMDNQFLGQTRNRGDQSTLNQTPVKLNSYFLRTIFDFSGKYLLTATLRTDGSSRFGANNRWGFFPSFSAAWKLDKEGFLPSAFTEAKLRFGWGKTGNQNFPEWASRDVYTPAYDNETDEIIYRQVNIGNPDLKWESTSQINIGFDYAFTFRLSGSFDYYHKKTNDLLYQTLAVQPAPPGAQFWQNLPDEVINSGFEIAMNYNVKNTANLKWDLGLNMAFVKNKLNAKSGGPFSNEVPTLFTGNASGQGLSGTYLQVMQGGYALNTFYLNRFSGFDENGQPILSDNPEYVGNPNPTFNLGFNTSVNYKSWDFVLNMYGSFGHHIYNNTANALFYQSAFARGSNVTQNVVDNGEAANAPIQTSTRFLEKGNFFRCANLTAGYTLDMTEYNGLKWMNSMRFYFTASNLFVLTDYTGYDPELNTPKTVDGIPSYGIDFSSYPKTRTFTFGINVNF